MVDAACTQDDLGGLMSTLTVSSPTTIAVVGDTGAGKSSLLNALLDHEDILVRCCRP